MSAGLGSMGEGLLHAFNMSVIGYFLLLHGSYLVLTLFAFRALRRSTLSMSSFEAADLANARDMPAVTLISPAYNEEPTCVESIRSLLNLQYASLEIVVVNDGSADRTLDRMKDAFALEPTPRAPVAKLNTQVIRGVYRSRRHANLWVVDKVNGGKADALNAGLKYCRTPLFCAVDADSLLEADALTRIARPVLEDSTTVAAGGSIRIANDCRIRSGVVEEVRIPRGRLARLQVVEYLRSFLCGRMAWDALDSTLIISGAFGMFQRATVVEAGGYATDTVGEDMELVVRLHRYCREQGRPYRVAFVPDPVAWTECPEDLATLGRQRDRWQRGLIESLWRHRVMMLNPRYGRIGLLAFPFYVALEVVGPVIEGLGYIAFAIALVLGLVSPQHALAFFAVAMLLGTALSMAAVSLEEVGFRRYPRLRDLVVLLGSTISENMGYRQLSTFWRIRGMTSKAAGARSWGAMQRKGFQVSWTDPV